MSMAWPSSLSKHLSHTTSFVACVAVMYSALVLDSATEVS